MALIRFICRLGTKPAPASLEDATAALIARTNKELGL